MLTGEEKPPSGFRYRTNFWSDILLVGAGLSIVQMATYFDGHRAIVDAYHGPVLMVSFIAYLLFAMFFAGIPRKRYFGYIYLGVFIAVLDAVCILLVEPWLLVTELRWNVEIIFLMISLFWVSCFILSGVAGLFAFRKRS